PWVKLKSGAQMPFRKPTSPRTTAASMVVSNASTSAAVRPVVADGLICWPDTAAATANTATHASWMRIKPPVANRSARLVEQQDTPAAGEPHRRSSNAPYTNGMRTSLTSIAVVLAAASVSAHIMVSPPQSKTGQTQKYELRVHNEEKVATTEVDLQIPDGVNVLSVGTAPAGAYTTSKTGDRITGVAWKVAVEPGKYLALPFTA